MAHSVTDTSVAHVLGVVDGVRRRWRIARVTRGVAISLAGVIVTLVAGALVLETVKYAPAAVIVARAVTAIVAALLLWRFVAVPLLPRPRAEQVALYVEEHDAGFQGALVSAVETLDPGLPPSPQMAERVRRMALQRAHAIGDGRDVDARGLRLSYAALGGAAATLLLVLTLGPQSLRYGMGALLAPWASAEEVNPFRLDIEPGDATVARGASVVVTARPVGFQADGVELWTRTTDSASWTRIPMIADSTSALSCAPKCDGALADLRFSARIFDVSAATEYLVESTGLRSRVYKLSVADLPYAKRIDLELRFPAYTQLPMQRVDSAGDIVAPAGTLARVRVTPTVPTPGGRIVIENGDTLQLVRAEDGTLSAAIRVSRSGFYRVELEGARGDLLTASLNYAIDVLPDRPPSVTFTRPGRDQRVLAVDEVFTEARAEDDYGIAKLEVVYSVNGGPEKVVPLHRATTRTVKDLTAGHTFMLEEFALQPGDLVSYFARATDNNAVGGPKSTTSDIYFLHVRSYAQEYRQEQGGGGEGGEGGGQGAEGPQQLSRAQREIIAGSFNVLRDSASKDRKTYDEDVATLRLAQQKVKNDVEELWGQMVKRGVADMDSGFAKIAEILPKAAAEMDTSEQLLAKGDVRGALRPQQRALQQVQRAEAEYRKVRVSMGNQGGGGGGGGGGAEAEDLADLFELQRERLRNQYETVQRGEQDERQQQDREVDAAAERLRQLAARQLQENERAQRKADSLAGAGASGARGGEAQRQLARETEETARQLERLARERRSESLAEAARRLNEASDAMRRSAGSQQGGGTANAAAMDRLREARRLLDQEKDSRTQRAVQEATKSARGLAEQERRVGEDVARQSGASAEERADLQRAIEERKGQMADSARELARRMDRAASDARREFPGVSRELQEAADTLRGRRIEEKIRQTQEWVRRSPLEYQNSNERIISADIDKLNRTVDEAQAALRSGRASDTTRRNADALDRARNLARAAESLAERARQQQEQQGPGARGEGQEGRQGQQRQQGQQGGGGARGGGNRQGVLGSPGDPNGQFGRELRQRLDEARALRRELSGRGVDLEQLDRAIAGMQGLSNRASLSDQRAERDLREQVIEGLRAFEFTLGRAFGERNTERALVDRAGEVPPEYRKYVEEYYRALGRARPR